jgi:hypothetical protein
MHSESFLFDLSISIILDLLIRNSSDIKSSFFPIEVLCNILERGAVSFNEEVVDNQGFQSKEDAVADIVLPLECLEGDRVDVLVCV